MVDKEGATVAGVNLDTADRRFEETFVYAWHGTRIAVVAHTRAFYPWR